MSLLKRNNRPVKPENTAPLSIAHFFFTTFPGEDVQGRVALTITISPPLAPPQADIGRFLVYTVYQGQGTKLGQVTSFST